MPQTVYNEFDSDTHRRVCAQCMRPRSALEIAHVLATIDPHVDDDARHADGVNEYLSDLEADGLIKNLGSFDDPESALKAQNADKDTVNFQGDKAVFINSAKNPTGFPNLETGDHWVMTNLGHARLTGEVPNE